MNISSADDAGFTFRWVLMTRTQPKWARLTGHWFSVNWRRCLVQKQLPWFGVKLYWISACPATVGHISHCTFPFFRLLQQRWWHHHHHHQWRKQWEQRNNAHHKAVVSIMLFTFIIDSQQIDHHWLTSVYCGWKVKVSIRSKEIDLWSVCNYEENML